MSVTAACPASMLLVGGVRTLVSPNSRPISSRLILCFREQQIADDAVAEVRCRVDEEIFPAQAGEAIRCYLSDDDVVELGVSSVNVALEVRWVKCSLTQLLAVDTDVPRARRFMGKISDW
jgi:hypothetical protein